MKRFLSSSYILSGLQVMLLFWYSAGELKSQSISQDLLDEIVNTQNIYSQRKQFDAKKMVRINELKEQLLSVSASGELELQYELHKQLFFEYFSFKSKEAFNSALQMDKIALQLKSEIKQVEATLCKADILLCSGLFYETLQAISAIDKPERKDLKADYYRILTRLYGDLKVYNDVPHFKHHYETLNNVYADSLLRFADSSSGDYQMVMALKLIDLGKSKQAIKQCDNYLVGPNVSDHQKAMIYSCMAWGANKLGDWERQIRYLLQSIEADIYSSTYETTSGRVLAQILLDKGEIELAHQFVLRAIEDAEFYGARQRKAEITHIIPIIETQLKALQQFKIRAITGISVLILISLLVILYLLLRLIKRHKEVKAGHEKINEQNELLSRQNTQLIESNKIKEEYLTNYFEMSSVYFHEIEKMQDKISSLLVQKKYASIAEYIEKSGPREDKERLFVGFDQLFLNLFPTFIDALNKVLDESIQIDVSDTQQKLTAELRVFALYRLGIASADRIASILGVSRNTVYTYRNRIKTKAKMEPDAFDHYIMEIPSC